MEKFTKWISNLYVNSKSYNTQNNFGKKNIVEWFIIIDFKAYYKALEIKIVLALGQTKKEIVYDIQKNTILYMSPFIFEKDQSNPMGKCVGKY